MEVSRELKIRLKLDHEPAYKIAQQAGVNPSKLSKLVNGIERLRPGDDRIVRVARILGLTPERAFASDRVDSQPTRLRPSGEGNR